MAADKKRKALGRGLSSLLPTGDGTTAPEGKRTYLLCPIEQIHPNKYQPRKVFNESPLNDLIASVKEKGILQPLIVRKDGIDKYELIAGERRWRAAQKAGLREVPVIIKEASDKESLELAIIENIQRDDLNPVEEAEGYKRLIDEFSYTQAELSKKVGKERATITNHLRILKLPAVILKDIAGGLISLGHAKAILSLDSESNMLEVARNIVSKEISVRETESMARSLKGGKKKKRAAKADPNIKSLEDRLTRHCGTKVRISKSGKKGKIEIDFYSADELERLLELIGL